MRDEQLPGAGFCFGVAHGAAPMIYMILVGRLNADGAILICIHHSPVRSVVVCSASSASLHEFCWSSRQLLCS